MQRTHAVLATILVIGLLSSVGWLLSGPWSLWVLWHQLPSGSPQSRVAMDASLVPRSLIETTTGIRGESFHQLGWQMTTSSHAVVARPRLFHQRAAEAALREAGYTVERHGGLWLRGEKAAATPERGWPSFLAVVRRVAASLVTEPQPLAPIFIASFVQDDTAAAPTVVVGVQHREGVQALLMSETLPAVSPRRAPVEEALQHGTLLEGPPSFLLSLPPASIAIWDQLLYTRLAFRLTKPNLINSLKDFSHVTIYVDEGKSGVMVTGEVSTFQTLARQWVTNEERRQRPQQRAFRLPDRTVGYEEIPGDVAAVFTAEPHEGCQAPLPSKTTLWLCATEERAVLATDETTARALLGMATEPVRFILTGFSLERLRAALGCAADGRATVCQLTQVELSGAGAGARLRATVVR